MPAPVDVNEVDTPKIDSSTVNCNYLSTSSNRKQEAGPCHRYIKNLRISAVVGSNSDGLARNELDSHADTCAVGSAYLRFADNGQKVSVSGYSDTMKPIKGVPVASVATVWEDPTTGYNYMLVFHECLYFEDRLDGTSLLNPNQMRANGLVVDDVARQFNTKSTHSIYIPSHDLRIPLELEGIHSGFSTRKPTWEEFYDTNTYPRIEMTSSMPWRPSSDDFAEKWGTISVVNQISEDAQTC